ncbi:MurR/RpiR family transcriptional regulator [Niallia taxi]|uniref:MurR/RpiR family transcriptional regulator n=1 Tax=Niallia taxi TaxID=2499688 RepID=A0A3S2TTV1_9BACI|nr:MurR/RpiR family transcriptional regulator [Niallia taxi]MCM3214546.1 MurR/RpiR family transcriptional regulator [Niallia taxi]MDK8643532.1 MurR/RpiR family transcriptional regulator [Niallia taxi]MED4056282.1 MurR/RpiR family transcriptional regulator [Niallia taxi]MED4119766.1 MurR/RpiR family transcriptional regulator [Niallia taxi]RVT56614.1 MurR/RpiR family transcriptional regulator [Niallia taxi]
MNFEERVQMFEYKLNDTDDQIIEYILQNKKDFTTDSIQTSANALYTVPNTITRLSKKLGYDSFSHLKNSMKDELQAGELSEQHHSLAFIKKTYDLIDRPLLEKIVKKLGLAKNILFYGAGDSADFCGMMVRNLRVIGKSSVYLSHRHEIFHMLNSMTKQDILLLISLSGETPFVLEIAEFAKERGVQTISLTHFKQNSLQKLADYNLYCFSPRRLKNGYNITDKTPLMIVLQALSEHYWETFK